MAANDPLVYPHLSPGVSEPQEPEQYAAVVVPPVASGSGNRPRRASVAPPVCELDSDDDEFMEDIPESLAEESPLNTSVASDDVYNSELEGYNAGTVRTEFCRHTCGSGYILACIGKCHYAPYSCCW